MDEIEFPERAKCAYRAIQRSSSTLRERTLCRMSDEKDSRNNTLSIGSCFAGVLVKAAEREKLTHIEYNPFEAVTRELIDSYSYGSESKGLLEPQQMHKMPLSKEAREEWLHLGKTYGLIPKGGRSVDNLLKKGIKLPLDSSPTAILGALIHMRHLWRERGFIKSVLFLTSKTNMDFWQAYVLASADKLANSSEHTVYLSNHRQRYEEKDNVNILLLPALRIAHEFPEEFDKRSMRRIGEWDTDRSFIKAARFRIWVDFKVLYDIDFRPLIYSDLSEYESKTKVVTFVKKLLGKKYKIDTEVSYL